MDRINYLLSGLDDMDKVVIFVRQDCNRICHTKKMIFRKEEVNQYHASDIIKIDGYISRFENDLREDYILLNVPDVWFRDSLGIDPAREEDFDLVFLPKEAIESISPSVETILKRFLKEMSANPG
ncbi:MAG TPA: hypothetical protein PLM00_07595 [Spirochaetota bacterium]|nr:hypothetical protein [Spirochaetota bacterium]HPN83241.1 hypothetical protein [Spirochaetota bacterium]